MEINDIYECPRCNNQLCVPSTLTEADKLEIVDGFRFGRKIENMVLIMKKLSIGLGESKLMMMHISNPRDHCARCSNSLLESGVTYCPACNALNINW